jgi:Flp pilus assembly protein TadG
MSPRPPDRGAIGVMLAMIVVVCLAGAGLVVDGGRALVARRHASNTAEAAARAGVATGSPVAGLDPERAAAAALSAATRSGVPADQITVEVTGRSVRVTVVERRPTIFLVLGGRSTMTVGAVGVARLEYSN